MKALFFVVCGLFFSVTGVAQAQSFGDAPAPRTNRGATAFEDLLKEKRSTAPTPETPKTEDVETQLKQEKALLESEKEEFFVPNGGLNKLFAPTKDNSKRGNATFVERDKQGNSRGNSKIFVYIDDFSMGMPFGSTPSCDATFVVLTNLDQKLTSLDMKLVWEGMTTAVSFSNVNPNTPTGVAYTLMGGGCYNMDKVPNIVVNRCRVKGMNSAACADKIVWLSHKR